ncbi:hypothetical protein [Solirubrobacter soli]|uniref:hypothetical protein n=1 Tax=Solirubrobacter soli TaxID=363832 RepID=UPI000424AA9D|nr:hypothetical protein [Solirubrobacter soli]
MSNRALNWSIAVIAVVVTLGVVKLTSTQARTPARPLPFEFDAAFPAADREWVQAAVRKTRPEAVTLIAAVAPRTQFVPTDDKLGMWVGMAFQRPPSGYAVRLNLARLDADAKDARDAAVVHELGHVVDMGLISPQLEAQLLAGIPSGGGNCMTSPCADTERFAETFAKWALRDDIPEKASYGIPSPASLEEWGAPLADMAARLEAQGAS